ncbi:MAG: LysR substrate-binding domain-containing protein [Myxococcales bacterium]
MCLGLRQWRQRDAWTLVGPKGEFTVKVRGSLSANQGMALRAAALAGLGVIMQPEMLLEEDLAAGRLVRVVPAYAPRPRVVHMVYAPDRRLPLKHRRFADFMLDSWPRPSRTARQG